jgi:hypothetical protein
MVPGATLTPLGFGICPSFKDHSLSRRAKPKRVTIRNCFSSLYVDEGDLSAPRSARCSRKFSAHAAGECLAQTEYCVSPSLLNKEARSKYSTLPLLRRTAHAAAERLPFTLQPSLRVERRRVAAGCGHAVDAVRARLAGGVPECRRRSEGGTAMKKLRIVRLGFGTS